MLRSCSINGSGSPASDTSERESRFPTAMRRASDIELHLGRQLADPVVRRSNTMEGFAQDIGRAWKPVWPGIGALLGVSGWSGAGIELLLHADKRCVVKHTLLLRYADPSALTTLQDCLEASGFSVERQKSSFSARMGDTMWIAGAPSDRGLDLETHLDHEPRQARHAETLMSSSPFAEVFALFRQHRLRRIGLWNQGGRQVAGLAVLHVGDYAQAHRWLVEAGFAVELEGSEIIEYQRGSLIIEPCGGTFYCYAGGRPLETGLYPDTPPASAWLRRHGEHAAPRDRGGAQSRPGGRR